MKKITIIRCLKLAALAIPVLLFILLSQQYLFYYTDHNAERIRRFYQEESNSLDVVFLGASEVFSAYAPGLAYETNGFTSYHYAIDSNPGALYSYQLKEVLSRQDPGLIFVEINGFLYNQPVEEDRLLTFTENIPFSLNELEAILQFKEEDKLGGFFPFVIYHGDWMKGRELIDRVQWRLSTSRNPSWLKGMITQTVVDKRPPEEITMSEEQIAAMGVSEDTLREFLEYCRKEQLDNVVFTRFPHRNAETQKPMVDQVEAIIQEYGYPFLNLENHTEAMDLDLLQDYYNSEHLNIYGQKKLTTYLADLVVKQFGLEIAVQSDSNRRHWESCAVYYHHFYDYAHEKLQEGTDIFVCEDILTFGDFQQWVDKRTVQDA